MKFFPINNAVLQKKKAEKHFLFVTETKFRFKLA